MCDFCVCSREERAKDTWVIPFLIGNKVVALNWNKLPSVSVKCTWELLLLAMWPFDEVGCSILGYASVQKLGHSALYRSLHSAPVVEGRTEGTHTKRENAADRELVFFLGNNTKRKKKGDFPWRRGNVEVPKGGSWCSEVEKETCFRSSSVWVWGLCFAFPALWRGVLFNSNYFTTPNLCLRIFCTNTSEKKNLSVPSNLLRLVLKVAFLRNP